MTPFIATSAADIAVATAAVLAFVVGLFGLSMRLPGSQVVVARREEGLPTTYRLNGLATFAAVVAVAAAGQALGWFSLRALHDHALALFVAANVLAFAMTGALYLSARGKPADAPPLRAPLAALKTLFFGAERNPSWFGVDLKMFSYRPSLIGLALINLSFAVVQYETYGRLGDAMIAYQVFTFVYVLNYFQFERGMVHTWDVIAERFGWMLIWGDYVLVPFFYSLPGWFLIDQLTPLPPAAIAGLVLLYGLGLWMFRGANEQKHRFKENPATRIWGRPAESLDGRLLVSGFWGIGRHLNYSGEICIYFAFTLTTGFHSPVPYLLPLWLVGLLAHRAWRDEVRCRAKYGALWARYTERARFRMIPFLY